MDRRARLIFAGLARLGLSAFTPGETDFLVGPKRLVRLAGEAKRPVFIHTGTSIFPGARNVYADPMACDDVAVDFPETTIVLCHAGRPLWYDTAFFLLRRHPNVMLDISSRPSVRVTNGSVYGS